ELLYELYSQNCWLSTCWCYFVCDKYYLMVIDSHAFKAFYRGVTSVVNQGSSRSHGQEAKG
ncbi:hypothetical protein KL866_17535, partial [Alteromonas sp. ALT199]|uniref:hypothetical protein n=1 Tax=Alteromonas sp. ALT199 TaxID=1298865 RepID=UPI001BE53ABD